MADRAAVSVDVNLAAEGYLRSADGRLRHIPGLECIARDTLGADVRVTWGTPRNGKAGCTYLLRRLIVLAPWVFDRPGYVVRDVWAHELGHCMVGRCCARARHWQEWSYGASLSPGQEGAGG